MVRTGGWLLLVVQLACTPGGATHDADRDGFEADADCDDTREDVHPGATETCDGQDNDCDGHVDEAGAEGEGTFYRDADADGFGAGIPRSACLAPEGFVARGDDCDDGDPLIHPDADDPCDGVDNDCSGDDDDDPAFYGDFFLDHDRDTFGDAGVSVAACQAPNGYVADSRDCDDDDPDVNPDAIEVCDGIDNDCAGGADEDSAADALPWYLDADSDGYGVPDPVVYACEVPAGWATSDDDCDDADADVYPGAREVCDHADNDCNGQEDDAAYDAPWWYRDADGDGHGDRTVRERSCYGSEGWTLVRDDCDDTDPERHPGLTEACDGIDNDCDSRVDEADEQPISGCDPRPDGADDRCLEETCAVSCSPGFEDRDGDLLEPAGNGCESPYSGPTFTEVAEQSGLLYVQWDASVEPCDVDACSSRAFTGGAAAADYDGDGWVDLYVTRLHDRDILFRNQGDGTFVDVSEQVGLDAVTRSNGAVFGDIDNDGDLDLYVTALGEGRFFLYVNHDGTFVEEGVERGASMSSDEPHAGFTATFVDFDRDGWLDLHTTEYRHIGTGDAFLHARLLHNLGPGNPGHFEDVTDAAGVDLQEDSLRSVYAFTTTWADLDRDGWPDLAVAADFGHSRLFWNDGDGTFTEGTVDAGVGTDDSAMGQAIADYDGDGDLDWFVTAILDYTRDCLGCSWRNFTGNRLYEYVGDRQFVDRSEDLGVRHGYWGWGAAMVDYDNDTDLDILHTNGWKGPAEFSASPNRLWRKEGAMYVDQAAATGFGDDTQEGRAMPVFDYDNDGDLDVFIVGHRNVPPRLFRNDGGNALDWLRVDLLGHSGNLQGVGARIEVRVTADDAPMVREVQAGGTYLGQNEITAHFGLGQGEAPVAEVRVTWPETGQEQILVDVPRNQRLLVEEPE